VLCARKERERELSVNRRVEVYVQREVIGAIYSILDLNMWQGVKERN
jgi:hypothetical protein